MKISTRTVLLLTLAHRVSPVPQGGTGQGGPAEPGPHEETVRAHRPAPSSSGISEHVWAAVGTTWPTRFLIHTPEGNVIVDTLMSPKRVEAAKKDLLASARPLR